MKSLGPVFNAILLVSGTSIGGGMLAQPVAASMIGYVPSFVMMLSAWIFMTLTALILCEVCLWEGRETHIISLSEKYFGKPGKMLAWGFYMFIAYLSLVAYIAGGEELIGHGMGALGLSAPSLVSALLFILFFGSLIKFKSEVIGNVNSVFMTGLLLSYLVIIAIGLPEVKTENLVGGSWAKASGILPLFLTSFSFQMMVPSLAGYLKYNRRHTYIAILAGTTLSLICYFLWNTVVIGAIGNQQEMAQAYAEGKLPFHSMQSSIGAGYFSLATKCFAFFALVTSFVGIAWGLFDFIADGLKWEKTPAKRNVLWLIVMIPPLFGALFYSRGFIGALEITGGFGDTILNGLLPIGMFILGAKSKACLSSTRKFHPVMLLALTLFCFYVIGVQIYQLII